MCNARTHTHAPTHKVVSEDKEPEGVHFTSIYNLSGARIPVTSLTEVI